MASDSKPDRNSAAANVIRQLSEDLDLRLSTDSRLTPRFNTLVRIAFHATEGSPVGTNYVIVRDQGRVGILLLSDGGLPFCFMTNGFIAAFEPNHTGRMVMYEGGNPSFSLRYDDKESRADLSVSYSSTAANPTILLDFPSLLTASLRELKSANLDESRSIVSLTTAHASATIELTAESAAVLPIKSLIFTDQNRHSVAIGPIGDGTKPSANVIGITPDLIASVGPIRRLTADELELISIVTPDGFATSVEEKSAAERFLSIFFRKEKR